MLSVDQERENFIYLAGSKVAAPCGAILQYDLLRHIMDASMSFKQDTK
jgi:hypothetical protein